MRHPSFVISLAAVLLPVAAVAQTSAVVDEGTFTVSRNGAPLGRESFRIARVPAPGGQVYLATGTSALGDERVSTALGTDASGVPVSYRADLKRNTELVRLSGRGRPGRFSVMLGTTGGESVKEYVLNNGALVLDENVFQHFFFVPMAAQHPQVIVINPRLARQERFQLQERAAENVEIAGRSIRGRHFVLTGESSGARSVWVDDQGRLLKVSIPDKGLVALRDDPPR